MSTEHNKQFLIAEFKVGDYTTEIYALNPGKWFEGFGGPRSGMTVSRKTASIIVRQSGPMGLTDTEYDIHDRAMWDSAFRAAALAKYNPKRK